jgi:hypothetical protein
MGAPPRSCTLPPVRLWCIYALMGLLELATTRRANHIHTVTHSHRHSYMHSQRHSYIHSHTQPHTRMHGRHSICGHVRTTLSACVHVPTARAMLFPSTQDDAARTQLVLSSIPRVVVWLLTLLRDTVHFLPFYGAWSVAW